MNWDLVLDALLDTAKMTPLLYLAFLLMEWLERKADQRWTQRLQNSRFAGPLSGALIGCIPQCGFAAAASKLFSAGIITTGTLLAVFVATSDEALPVLLSHPEQWRVVVPVLGAKLIIGIVAGILTDVLLKNRHQKVCAAEPAPECSEQEGNMWWCAAKHTLQIALFILVFNVAMNTVIHWIGQEKLSALLWNHSWVQPIAAAAIGLIPNCAVSVLLTELYVSGSLSFGSLVAGLCTGAGMGLVVLFRENKNTKQNLTVLCALLVVGIASGLILHLFGY